MCFILATYYLTEQHVGLILNEWRLNSDGGGIAYIDPVKPKGNRLTVEKGLMKHSDMKQMLKTALHTTCVAHLRSATSGAASATNTHPFWVCNNEAVMFHNGILQAPFCCNPHVSDTMVLASALQHLRVADILREINDIERHIGWNKLVLLTQGGFIVIVNDHLGEWLSKQTVWVSTKNINAVRTYGGHQRFFSEDEEVVSNLPIKYASDQGTINQVG